MKEQRILKALNLSTSAILRKLLHVIWLTLIKENSGNICQFSCIQVNISRRWPGCKGATKRPPAVIDHLAFHGAVVVVPNVDVVVLITSSFLLPVFFFFVLLPHLIFTCTHSGSGAAWLLALVRRGPLSAATKNQLAGCFRLWLWPLFLIISPFFIVRLGHSLQLIVVVVRGHHCRNANECPLIDTYLIIDGSPRRIKLIKWISHGYTAEVIVI